MEYTKMQEFCLKIFTSFAKWEAGNHDKITHFSAGMLWMLLTFLFVDVRQWYVWIPSFIVMAIVFIFKEWYYDEGTVFRGFDWWDVIATLLGGIFVVLFMLKKYYFG